MNKIVIQNQDKLTKISENLSKLKEVETLLSVATECSLSYFAGKETNQFIIRSLLRYMKFRKETLSFAKKIEIVD
jgi:hypothetical protein